MVYIWINATTVREEMFSAKREDAVSAIRRSFSVLSTETNLSPRNERVTASLTHLVRKLSEHSQSPDVTQFLLQTPDLKAERENLPGLCGAAECEMEKFWSHKLAAEKGAKLEDFWYYQEYCELTRAETALFGDRSFDGISFLGAGALPITAFLLAGKYPKAKITCVDYDREACMLAANLTRKLGLEKQIEVLYMDALDYAPGNNELVIYASLLKGRDQIYSRVDHRDCALVVRDSEGIYQFLYKSAELPEQRGFREVSRTSIDPKRINTSRYYEPLKNAA